MKKNFIIVAVVILAIVGVLAGVKALQIRALMASGASFSMPPETISGTEVKEETWESLIPAIGSVTAVQGVLLRASQHSLSAKAFVTRSLTVAG